MHSHIIFGVYIFIILTILPPGLSIKCWDCRSNYDPKCGEPFDNSTLPITDCNHVKGLLHMPGSYPSMCQKIKLQVNGEWYYVRGCATGAVDIQSDAWSSLSTPGTHDLHIEYTTCNNKDGCNSSSTFAPLPLLLLTSVALLSLLLKGFV